jgi:hypothetical protein
MKIREAAYGISAMIYETLGTINCKNKHARDKWAKDKGILVIQLFFYDFR